MAKNVLAQWIDFFQSNSLCYVEHMKDDEPVTLAEAAQPGPESTDSEYLAWKERGIRAALRQSDANPDAAYTDEQVFGEIKQNSVREADLQPIGPN